MSTLSFTAQPLGLRFVRPALLKEGSAAGLHPLAAAALDLLDTRLGRGFDSSSATSGAVSEGTNATPKGRTHDSDLITALTLPIYSHELTVKTLLKVLDQGGDERLTLAEYGDRKGHTKLYFDVRQYLRNSANGLDYNPRQILAYPNIVDYLITRAWALDKLDTAEGIFNYLTSAKGSWKRIYDYVVSKATWDWKKQGRIELPDSSVDDQIVARLQKTLVSLEKGAFAARLTALFREYVYDADNLAILEAAEAVLGDIPAADVAPLLAYLKQSKIPITKDNAAFFVSIALTQLNNAQPSRSDVADGGLSVEDYAVDYYDEATTSLEFDRSSVEAAAMLFYTMVWGDQIGIFEVADRIVGQTATQYQIAVTQQRLADDLALYALDERFEDLKNGGAYRRIPPAERQMFYRQVFGVGQAPVTDGMAVNSEFARLWAVLMTETARYIAKVEENAGVSQAVSPQKVYQAIEDLQYNLSSFCGGMAKVTSPRIYREMDFVVRRLLDSTDVKAALSRRGTPSFWRVIETVRGTSDLNPLRNKGIYGHKILSTIARATPALVEDTTAFGDFISTIDAYIVAESQLSDQGDGAAVGGESDGGGYGALPGMPSGLPGMPSGLPGMPGSQPYGAGPTAGGGGSGDWNF